MILSFGGFCKSVVALLGLFWVKNVGSQPTQSPIEGTIVNENFTVSFGNPTDLTANCFIFPNGIPLYTFEVGASSSYTIHLPKSPYFRSRFPITKTEVFYSGPHSDGKAFSYSEALEKMEIVPSPAYVGAHAFVMEVESACGKAQQAFYIFLVPQKVPLEGSLKKKCTRDRKIFVFLMPSAFVLGIGTATLLLCWKKKYKWTHRGARSHLKAMKKIGKERMAKIEAERQTTRY